MFLWTRWIWRSLGFRRSRPKHGASGPMHQRSAEALFYGTEQVRSSRGGGEARRNLEVLWLINRVARRSRRLRISQDHAKRFSGYARRLWRSAGHNALFLAASFWDRRHEDRRGCQPQAGDQPSVPRRARRWSTRSPRIWQQMDRSDHEEGTQEAAVDVAKAWRPLRSARGSNASPTSWPQQPQPAGCQRTRSKLMRTPIMAIRLP